MHNMKLVFDEQRSAGVDYNCAEQARRYDSMHQRFRNYEQAAMKIIERLGLGADSTVIDMGAGTGAFAVPAAKVCKQIHAVDISEAMLAECQAKAQQAGLENIVCHVGGFLSYTHDAPPADAMVSVAVLHHLPDFWKQIALQRAAQMLKPGGRLWLFDIVFPVNRDLEEHDKLYGGWIATIAERAGKELADEAKVHLLEEHSTYEWILEGMLERAGFHIDRALHAPGFQTTYVCTRQG